MTRAREGKFAPWDILSQRKGAPDFITRNIKKKKWKR